VRRRAITLSPPHLTEAPRPPYPHSRPGLAKKSPSLVYAVTLIVLGVAGYTLTGAASVTALIPAFFGVVVLLLALGVNGRPGLAWALLVVAILGIGGTVKGALSLPAVLDGTAERPPAVISQSIMLVLSVVYVVVWLGRKRASPPG